jgi:hypothetical protein
VRVRAAGEPSLSGNGSVRACCFVAQGSVQGMPLSDKLLHPEEARERRCGTQVGHEAPAASMLQAKRSTNSI